MILLKKSLDNVLSIASAYLKAEKSELPVLAILKSSGNKATVTVQTFDTVMIFPAGAPSENADESIQLAWADLVLALSTVRSNSATVEFKFNSTGKLPAEVGDNAITVQDDVGSIFRSQVDSGTARAEFPVENKISSVKANLKVVAKLIKQSLNFLPLEKPEHDMLIVIPPTDEDACYTVVGNNVKLSKTYPDILAYGTEPVRIPTRVLQALNVIATQHKGMDLPVAIDTFENAVSVSLGWNQSFSITTTGVSACDDKLLAGIAKAQLVFEHSLLADKDILTENLTAFSKFLSKDLGPNMGPFVEFTADFEHLELTAQSKASGQLLSRTIPLQDSTFEPNAAPIKFILNADYCVQALKSLPGDTIDIKAGNGLNEPVVFMSDLTEDIIIYLAKCRKS